MKEKKPQTAQPVPPKNESLGDAGLIVRRREFGGPKGPEPTRYGDWEQKGRCTDF